MRALCQNFRAIHPAAPVSLKCYLSKDALIAAVQANDISLLYVGRATPEIKLLDSMEAKLLCRPDLAPMVDWCIEWMQSERNANRVPTHRGMQTAWDLMRSTTKDALFHGEINPGFAGRNYWLRWRHFLQYERAKASGAPGIPPGVVAAEALTRVMTVCMPECQM